MCGHVMKVGVGLIDPEGACPHGLGPHGPIAQYENPLSQDIPARYSMFPQHFSPDEVVP